ncbi:DNA internalization-related competence protein ComEC/Rec2 [Deinococcus sp. KNUC1210]|uniref:DNA internalization-related competence protein ComEC/Rec2 n=1 Tax=Deinococcus sp. KNUC1210 TaxID=2917691 RepID=UPI001EF04A15|nr:DNA internalization-related competence protein ComEC/Rec2 [Deinococcus sp. KNUC1210]ULH14860.1 DNA internalization-related competence protein ComEC/Rec2 [Deinococcus sp. KNUC1210]
MTGNVGRHAQPVGRVETTDSVVPVRPDIQQAAWWQRIPAAVPLVFGMIAGILLGFASGWWVLATLLALGLTAASRRWWLTGLVLLAGGAGYVREQNWEHAPDLLAGYVGGTLTLQGHWDGQFLSLKDPAAKVALSPKPTDPPGELRVSGVLVRPAGVRIPGGFDDAFWLRAQGVHELLAGAAVRSSVPERGIRGWFRRGLAAGLTPQQAALLTAVELGDKNAVSHETFEGSTAQEDGVQTAFTRAGLAHLMALSGQNVALLTGLLTLLFIRTPLGRIGLARYPVMIVLLGAFLWLVGPSPSITRAVLMGAAVLAGQWSGRGRLDVYGVLALTALVGLAAQPAWLFDVGFVLSYLAVLGLTLSSWAASRLPERWPTWIRFPLVATVLAEAATLPVVAGSFHQVPLTGLPANLLAEGVMAALVPLGFLAGLLGPLGFVPNALNGLLLNALLWIAHTFGQAPVLSWGMIGAAGFAAYAVFAAALTLWLTRRVRLWALALTALLCTLGTALPARLQTPREVVYLDVGQGDSTLIRAGALRMLIDGGGTPRGDYDVGAKTVVPALHALGVHALEIVVATHADADHIEGLVSVLKLLPVGELWIGQRKTEDPLLAELLDVADLKHIPVREVRRGDGLQAGDISLTVLWPRGQPWSTADNDNSVVIRLDSPRFHTAVLGDLPDPAETLLGMGQLDLLKTAHHGSRFSSTDPFLNETQPKDVVISVGRNTYGHPNPDLLARLAARGVRVWRTDQVGTVRWPIP